MTVANSSADSIFFDNDRTIFATFKYVGDDWDGDMKRMSENPKVREWWALTDGMQVCFCVSSLTVQCIYAFTVLIYGVGKSCSWCCEQFRGSWMVEGVG